MQLNKANFWKGKKNSAIHYKESDIGHLKTAQFF